MTLRISPMDMANRIRRLRLQAGLNQSELATRLHTTRQTISRYEKGDKPNRVMVGRMAKFFGVAPGFIEHGEAGQALSPGMKGLLAEVIAAVRRILGERGIDPAPEKYATLLVAALSQSAESGTVSEDRIRELIDLIQ